MDQDDIVDIRRGDWEALIARIDELETMAERLEARIRLLESHQERLWSI